MSVKDEVLARLLAEGGEPISGEELAAALHVTRSAVWKAIRQLRADGCTIEGATNRGYRLLGGDVLSREAVCRHLHTPGCEVTIYKSVPSTNTLLKGWAEEGRGEGCVVLAEEQTAGRGRRGRRFYSPKGSGLYLSVLLRPTQRADAALQITTCAAVAVAETVEQFAGRGAQIKWVNDVFLDGRKVAGILTEASLDVESGSLRYAILGIGVNLLPPPGGFPEELEGVAGAVFSDQAEPGLRAQFAAALLDRFFARYRALGSEACFEAYRRRLCVLGRRVTVLSGGEAVAEAEVLELGRDYSLLVRYEDGLTARLSSGEVSIHP